MQDLYPGKPLAVTQSLFSGLFGNYLNQAYRDVTTITADREAPQSAEGEMLPLKSRSGAFGFSLNEDGKLIMTSPLFCA